VRFRRLRRVNRRRASPSNAGSGRSSPAGAFMRNVCLLVMLALASVSTYAAESASKTDPRAVIAKKIPGVEIDDVRPSPIKGLYEVRIGGESVYATADGRYVI